MLNIGMFYFKHTMVIASNTALFESRQSLVILPVFVCCSGVSDRYDASLRRDAWGVFSGGNGVDHSDSRAAETVDGSHSWLSVLRF